MGLTIAINRRFARGFCLTLLLLYLFSLPLPAHAGKQTTVLDKDWQKTFALMRDKDPVAGKLLTWIYATQTDLQIEPKDLMKFVAENPDWPRLSDFRRKVEEEIGKAGLPALEIARWFHANPATTHDGIKTLMIALRALGHEDAAQTELRRFWRGGAKLDRNETAALAAEYRQYLSAGDHAARLDTLLWEDRYSEAEYMLAFVGAGTRATGQARIALGRDTPDAARLLDAVPAALQNDEGILFSRARRFRKKRDNDRALDLLRKGIAGTKHAEAWWGEQNVLARRLMEEKKFREAHDIIALHAMQEASVDYAQAEWLLGWLKLRFLDKPRKAQEHFSNLYRNVSSAISKSRAAYWAARAGEALGMADVERLWDEEAAAHISTYYGQLSYRKLYGAGAVPQVGDPPLGANAEEAFNASDLVRAARLLKKAGLEQCYDSFLAKIIMNAHTNAEYLLAARLAAEIGRPYYVVQANKDIQQNLGSWLLTDGYPVLRGAPSTPDKGLVHAIIYRESMFNTEAISPAGARGLMQLMPATAKSYARIEKQRYSSDRLISSPDYNMRLGASYLRSLMSKYKNNAPIVIATYNAGPGNVVEWTKTFGHPADEDVGIIDWVELIPNYETRNYVQRVMETWYMYNLKFGAKPKTVLDYD